MPEPAPDQPSRIPVAPVRDLAGGGLLLDSFIVAVITMILAAAGVLQGVDLESFDQAAVRELMRSNSGITITLILFAYFLILEGLWGRTPGKAGPRHPRRPCPGRVAVRLVALAHPQLHPPARPAVPRSAGGAVVLMTPARQRLGDLVGGTLVVRTMQVPAEMAAVIPGLLRRCSGCGRLAAAGAACPSCAAPPPVPPDAARRQFGAAMMQPFVGVMAAGEAAAAVRVAAQAVLAAEAAYAEASAAESARLEGESAAAAVAPAADDVAKEASQDAGPFVTPKTRRGFRTTTWPRGIG